MYWQLLGVMLHLVAYVCMVFVAVSLKGGE